MKLCNGCGQHKPLSEFYIRKIGERCYPRTICKSCHNRKPKLVTVRRLEWQEEYDRRRTKWWRALNQGVAQ